jgi:hypothetical protein
MAVDEISGTQKKQTLALQQMVPWASSTSSAQGCATVDTCSTDAISNESDDADAAWSSAET